MIVAIAAGTAAPAFADDLSSAPRTTWDGVYSEEQAERGERVYAEHCAICHAQNMEGAPGSPALIGAGFTFVWDGETVGALYEYLRTMMPPGQVGLLGDQRTADVLAAVLKANGFPSAEAAELTPDAVQLSGILFEREQ